MNVQKLQMGWVCLMVWFLSWPITGFAWPETREQELSRLRTYVNNTTSFYLTTRDFFEFGGLVAEYLQLIVGNNRRRDIFQEVHWNPAIRLLHLRSINLSEQDRWAYLDIYTLFHEAMHRAYQAGMITREEMALFVEGKLSSDDISEEDRQHIIQTWTNDLVNPSTVFSFIPLDERGYTELPYLMP